MRSTDRFHVAPLDAQRLIELLSLRLIPSITAGVIAYEHVHDIGAGVLVFASMFTACELAERVRYPLHLMPTARLAIRFVAPLVGAVVALVIGALSLRHITVADFVSPLIGAWLLIALGTWISDRFKSDRQARVAVVGPPTLARGLALELASAAIHGYEVIGWIGPPPARNTQRPGLPWLGSLDDVRSAVIDHGVDLLVFGQAGGVDGDSASTNIEAFEQIARGCLDLPVRMIDANQFYEELLGHVPVGTIDAAWFRYIMHPRYRGGSPFSKRAVDLILAIVGGLIVLPLLIVAAIAIKLTDGGPALYRQRRAGEHGAEFEIVKLRSMRVDAEQPGSPQWSSAEDERVTRVGRILRRLHIDELPQVWNVLRGEMTMVGPRPERPELLGGLEAQFPHYERRHLVKPGITGWAQVRCGYAGSEEGSAWKLGHDLYYLKHRSTLADLLLIMETLFTVERNAQAALPAPDEQFILGPAQVGSEVSS